MQWRNTARRYGLVARFFHWSMFLLIGLTTFLALNIETMPEADRDFTIWLHRSFGVLIGGLLLLRVAWKLANLQPADLPGPAWMSLAAHVLHWGLYGIVLVQVVAGIVMSQADGATISPFGLFSLPALVSADPGLEAFWRGIHETVWIVLTVLVIGHVLAALHHHFSESGDVFDRMGVGSPRQD